MFWVDIDFQIIRTLRQQSVQPHLLLRRQIPAGNPAAQHIGGTLQRSLRTEESACGPVRVKTAEGWGVRREKPEYEDLARIARERGISLREAAALIDE